MRTSVALCLTLTVTGLVAFGQAAHAQCNGNMGVRAYFAPGTGPSDITGLRYAFHAAENIQAGLDLKILFGFSRLYTPGAIDTYLLESNLYTRGLRYSDPICTTWPLLGTLVGSETSLRLAVPDYVGLGKTGAKTFAPFVFPRQSYLIDGLPIPKTDAISQMDLGQTTTEVVITRGDLVSDKTGWKCAGSLDADTYLQWDASVNVGATAYHVAFALPEGNARYITSGELIGFRTEFFLFSGLFKVYLWDFEFMRESTGSWEPLNEWIVDDHCGDASAYGVRIANFEGRTVLEISNDGPGSFLPVGTIFELGLSVEIDIRPGSDRNRVNPKSRGVIPVAILSTRLADGDATDFDATQVDETTLRFGPGEVGIAHRQAHVADVDGDGDRDLLLHFRTRGAGIACGDTEATLKGGTFDGMPITGAGAVDVVGCKRNE